MGKQTDDWVEDRILWRFRRDGFPRDWAYLFRDIDKNRIPASMQPVTNSPVIGRPVIALVGDEGFWTLLGTKGLISSKAGVLEKTTIAAVADLSHDLLHESSKEQAEFLWLKDCDGNLRSFWTGPGEVRGEMASLLLMLIRMRAA
jgi:hypothetical protein